jgi:DUF4097 and DUF4098 domain-containing protein YvlB
MRLALLPVVMLLPAACGIADWGDSRRFKEEFRQTYQFEPGGRLVVEGFNGGVEIRGWDRPSLEVECVKYAAREEDLGRIRMDVAVNGGLATVRALRSEDLLRPGSVGVDYRIMAPARAVLDRVVTTNGAIRTEGFQGAVRASTANGPIHVGRHKGSMELKTSNGPVTVTEGEGTLQVETSNAPVKAEIRGGGEERVARLRTTNGPVELRIEGKLMGDVDVRTSNGPITVRLAEGSGFRLRARTTNGRVTSDFAVEPGTRERRTRMEGTVGAGGPVVELNTSNGAVGVIRH